MAATQKIEVEQMRLVLEEMNTHPEARLFFALQERGACIDADPHSPPLTLRLITDKVNRYMYPNLSAFVEDMTMVFSSCPSNTPLASGAVALRELFSELLAKYTNVLDGYDTTPPGKKKRLRNSASPIPFMSEDEEDLFLLDSEDEFADLALVDDFAEEFMQGSDRAALLELTSEIASIEAEIQKLKDSEDSSQPGFNSHPSVLDALKTPSYMALTAALYSSGAEEGRVALSPRQNKKRPRRNSNTQTKEDDWTQSKRRTVDLNKEMKEFQAEIMTKEQLLYTITNDLPPKFLEGVIRIVNPTYDPGNASEEDLEFDINLLDDDVLARLQQYVNTILKAPPPPKKKVTRPQTKVVTHKKETPKKRLQKEAPKKVNRKRAAGSRKRSTTTTQSKQKKQQTLLAATLTKRPFVSAEIMKQIFMKEEIVRVKKSTTEEDEEVDILD